jgi:MoCo/4Fe-4S cofactor protein with predicted Tat translocation signal
MSNERENMNGGEYWRSLDQLADTPEFLRFVEQEFPDSLPELDNPISRRKFLSVMGASLALAGLAGCRKPVEKIIPYVSQPEEVIPGVPSYYATTMPSGASAYGLIVECHEGRPTKIEGNPQHPSTLGRSNVFIQAEMLNLYDPDRSDKILHNNVETSWDAFVTFWRERLMHFRQNKGEDLAILSTEFSSPTLFRLGQKLRKDFGDAVFAIHDAVEDVHLADGDSGSGYQADYHYDKAKVIVSLDADFLLTESENVVAARRFADGRRIKDVDSPMNRLYVIESDLTTTGAMADHRLRVPRSMVGAFAAAIVNELEKQGVNTGLTEIVAPSREYDFDRQFVSVLAENLAQHKGECLIVAGRTQPGLETYAAALNEALGNVGKTVTYHKPELTPTTLRKNNDDSLENIVKSAQNGKLKTLVIFGGNPIYDSPTSSGFVEALKSVEYVIYFGPYVNETAQAAEWHIPSAHFLESWGDTRAGDGTLGLIQPMIQPLFGGKSDVEFLGFIATGDDRRGYDIVRETWDDILKGGDFERKWRRVLHDGVLAQERKSADSYKPEITRDHRKALAQILRSMPTKPSIENIELTFQVSPTLYDGRYANNGWLQELPHPTSKLTWDNAAYMSPVTARELRMPNSDVVRIANDHGEMELPVWIVPGQADYTVSVELGYGRTAAGRVGNGIGANAYKLRPDRWSYFATGIKLTKTGRKHKPASTQDHGAMDGRPIVREADVEVFRKDPDFAKEMVEHAPLIGIYPPYDYSHGYQWGMAIDLTACVGCNACTIACQSENNIPVVGRPRVLNGREMHWIRVDRYFTGDADNPKMVFMPVPCQQCENAPCETVCPVAATVHDKEGLNVMTYNRCIGTRYCSNNCPYKVRRFNFFNYTSHMPDVVRMAMNPDVTVRCRGVMEKCSYCIQRINRAKINAKRENRTVQDGEIVTACQQACPADAIVFGNINDPESKVAKIKALKRNYALLAEYNLKPRNSYMARIRNPHPKLKDHEPRHG